MDKKGKRANETFMKRVNNKLIKKGWDESTKSTTRKKNEADKIVRNVYDRGDSKQSEQVKDGKISIDNLMEDIQMRNAVKMGLKKKMDKPKTFPKNNNINITPQKSNEKAEDTHFYRFSDSKERKKILNKYTFKLKGDNNISSPIIVNKDETKRLNDAESNFKTGERKKNQEKYAFKIKGESHYISNGPLIVNKEENKRTNDIVECCFKTADKYFAKKQINLEAPSKKFESVNLEIKTDRREEKATGTTAFKKDVDKDVQRKPIIKTIASKNDSKIYKAVTFANKKKRTQLQINMPSDNKIAKSTRESSARLSSAKQRENLSDPKMKSSKTSVKDKLKKKKKVSPDFSKADMMQTEVAMWAPSSVNPHTQPYYEAWVDKTLTAISRLADDDEALRNHINVTQFYRVGTRDESPDLTYANYADERYTGRIKVTQR